MFFCGAFCSGTKLEIKERAEYKSELSGRDDRPLQCAHLIHGKKHNKNAEMGMYVADVEHLAHHLMFENNPRAIGLSRKSNDGAINALLKQLHNDPTFDITREEVGEALTLWEEFYESKNI